MEWNDSSAAWFCKCVASTFVEQGEVFNKEQSISLVETRWLPLQARLHCISFPCLLSLVELAWSVKLIELIFACESH
jgi:hypothetical protein